MLLLLRFTRLLLYRLLRLISRRGLLRRPCGLSFTLLLIDCLLRGIVALVGRSALRGPASGYHCRGR